MRDDTVEYKVKVFISSRCDGRYFIVRKALKTLIEETNIAMVYTFETSGPSSQNVINSYISSLDDSDLCIFLIDNKDGVSNPVLIEHKRARELGKKSIYLFCDEKKKKPTQLQMEIYENHLEKYYIVHEFADLINKSYHGVIQDIVNIYREYCHGRLFDKIDYKTTDLITPKTTDTYKLDKRLFKGFGLTQNELVKITGHGEKETGEITELDLLCQKLLQIVIGKETVGDYSFEDLKRKLSEIHEILLREIILSRVDAIRSYFLNDLQQCLSHIESAYSIAISNANVPNWLLNDILIDMRHIQALIDETNNTFSLHNKGQQLLDDNCEKVYYPLLDRYDANFKKDVLKACLDEKTDTPYTISYKNLNYIFQDIANTYIVSVVYGSLTHILATPERLVEALSSFCLIYRNHSMYIEVLKQLIMCQKDGEIKKIIRTYNQTTDIINPDDINYLIAGVNTIPLNHKKLISKLILFEHLGYYFSDDQYEDVSNELISDIDEWIKSNNRIFNIYPYIFRALKNNVYRLSQDKLLAVLLDVFQNGLRRFYDEALQVIERLDFINVSPENEGILIDQLILIISNAELRNACYKLSEAIIHIRKNAKTKRDVIDNGVKEYMADFFDKTYSLEVFGNDKKCPLKYINYFIDAINKQNEEQGKNNTYHGYAGNPYQTIRNIIEYENLILEWADVEKILDALSGTMFAPRQTFEAKIRAINLVIYLKNKSWFDEKIENTIDKWLDNQNDILSGHEGVLEKESLAILKFSLLLLKISFGKHDLDELLSNFAYVAQLDDYEIIKSMECIENLLYNINFDDLDMNVLLIITQYIISISTHKERDARYYSARILLILCRSEFKSLALEQLSKMMDKDIYEIKITILRGVGKMSCAKDEIIKYIVQKGEIDNHFLVRQTVKDIVNL